MEERVGGRVGGSQPADPGPSRAAGSHLATLSLKLKPFLVFTKCFESRTKIRAESEGGETPGWWEGCGPVSW